MAMGCCKRGKGHLLKPLTYMNLSGESIIAEVMNFFKIEVDELCGSHV